MNYPVPHHAKARRVREGPYHEFMFYTWEENGQQMGYKVAITPGLFTEVYEFGCYEPIMVQNVPIQAPPPPEPASLFATRQLTEDELLDPNLFNPLAYEPILDRMIR